jgi:hypothetical protein
MNLHAAPSQSDRCAETANSASRNEDRIVRCMWHLETVQPVLTCIVWFLVEAIGRVRLQRANICVIGVECGAIRANDLIVCSHIQVNMGVIHGRTRAHTLKLLHTNVDFLYTDIIAKMGRAVSRHRVLFPLFRDLTVDAAALGR